MMSYRYSASAIGRLLISLFLVFVNSCIFTSGSTLEGAAYVSCGSAIKLTHVASGGRYTLSSISGQTWGGGSGQQVVTLISDKAESSSLWQVREGHNQTQCITGKPVKCGQTIRLMHLKSQKNLHTHPIPSALSGQQEVSGYGDKGEGNHGDDWQVLCNGTTWQKHQTVRIRHEVTGAFLAASKSFVFNEQNCRNCPILKHMEVAGTMKTDETSHFQVGKGIFLTL